MKSPNSTPNPGKQPRTKVGASMVGFRMASRTGALIKADPAVRALFDSYNADGVHPDVDADRLRRFIDPAEAARLQSRERGTQILRGRAVAALAISSAVVAGGALLANNLSSDDSKPKPAPVTTELETVGTTIPIVDEQGEGVVELVGEEADASNVQIDWKTTQSLVEKARELNEREPRFGEPYILPDIPNAEPTSPVAPTTAP